MSGAPACPFVAFEDDRESRSASPDHRHRCYADLVPSPRAAAHQEAYCLSSAFPVCPTFQDWARREAAQAAAGPGGRGRPASAGEPGRADDRGDAGAQEEAPEWGGDAAPRHSPATPPPVQRNPPRDWAAPPPWATGAGMSASGSRRSGGDAGSSGYLGDREAGQGLAGSAADRLATALPSGSDRGERAATSGAVGQTPRDLAADPELAGLVSGRFDPPDIARPEPRPAVIVPREGGVHGDAHEDHDRDYLPPTRGGRRPTVSSSRRSPRHHEREVIEGPSWERARRFEAYPTLRARTGLNLGPPPRIALMAGALVVAAVALFFLPALLGVGGGGGDEESPQPSASASAGVASPSVAPTEPPAPTPQVYIIKAGDTLSSVAADHGITLQELLAANPTIEDPDRIAIGDEIIIPSAPPEEFIDPSASPS